MTFKLLKQGNSGTKVVIMIVGSVVALILLTFAIIASNPSSKSQKTTVSKSSKKSTAQSTKATNQAAVRSDTVKSTSTTLITTTTTSVATNMSTITTFPPSSSVAKSLTTFVGNLSGTESSAASAAQITYHGFILSPAVLDGQTPVALAAFSYDPNSLNVKVMAYQQGQWTVVAELARPSDEPAAVDPSFPWMVTASYSPGITVGDVTNNRKPTFLIPLDFADNIPGAFVIQTSPVSISSWQYANFYPFGKATPTNVLARNPSFVGTEIRSTYNNCNPDCASGTVTAQYWQFDQTKQAFRMQAPS
ncbi:MULTISPECIES: hypothetical protein [Acidithrix]|uniref:Uncharacterized protein n=1 Tax=Acidithrix ferrooxidans TaxID=1280514 RepID=A0A0D8HKI7_9ACTN|nr:MULTISPECIES: hypothetical protein [Acidithrix]KJF18475.1 hypothetical protein AXFE_06460 [Acidithrix ferrooxidans]CAG4906861.1 unnamed protein product [Acidithrix sp. C25]